MTAPTPAHERDIFDRIRDAYVTAQAAQHDVASVSIHIGQDVWDHMKSLATHVSDKPWSLGPNMALLYGFPLVLETDWAPDAIQVRANRTIA